MRTGHQSLSITFEGDGVENLKNEAGGHRLQRVPKSERNGRVHSSSVTLAVIFEGLKSKSIYDQRSDDDFDIQFYGGTGPGGQHKNKCQTSARIKHVPTGIVRQAQTRSRENSRKNAMEALHKELDRQALLETGLSENKIRKNQIGTGERSDKRRTYQFQNDIVTDHVSGKKSNTRKIFAGNFRLLW